MGDTAVTKVDEYMHGFFQQICMLFVDPDPALYAIQPETNGRNIQVEQLLEKPQQQPAILQLQSLKLLFVHFSLVEVYQLH